MGDEALAELMQPRVNKTVAEARETGRGKRLEAKAFKAGEEVFYEREVIGTISPTVGSPRKRSPRPS